jgi:hypothetical protein
MLTRIRSAITGRFVRRSTADRHPESTLAEHRSGRELRLEAIAAAAAGVIESKSDELVVCDRNGAPIGRAIAVGAVELGRLAGAVRTLEPRR